MLPLIECHEGERKVPPLRRIAEDGNSASVGMTKIAFIQSFPQAFGVKARSQSRF